MRKQRGKKTKNRREMIYNESEYEEYKWSKYRYYCELVIKSVLAFILGILCSRLLRFLNSVHPCTCESVFILNTFIKQFAFFQFL